MLFLQILSSLVDIEKQLTDRIEGHDSFEECMKPFVKQLTTPIINDLASLLNRGDFDQKNQEDLIRRVSNLTLYKAFFEEELVQKVMSLNVDDFNLDTKIPAEVRQNNRMMGLLKSIARRIEHMQLPRYESLKKLFLEVICLCIKDDEVKTMFLFCCAHRNIALLCSVCFYYYYLLLSLLVKSLGNFLPTLKKRVTGSYCPTFSYLLVVYQVYAFFTLPCLLYFNLVSKTRCRIPFLFYVRYLYLNWDSVIRYSS